MRRIIIAIISWLVFMSGGRSYSPMLPLNKLEALLPNGSEVEESRRRAGIEGIGWQGGGVGWRGS